MQINWDRITHYFQIPLGWFRDVDRRSKILTDGKSLKCNRNDPEGTSLEIDPEGLADELGVPSADTGTEAADHSDSPDELDQTGESWTWTAGAADGFTVDVYRKIETSGSYHLFQRCRLTLSKDGLIVSAEAVPGRVRIRA